MIFELAQDFHDAVTAMPTEHPKHRMLELLLEAVRRDINFIDRHPTTLFQCMWNTCWWYDCPEAARHYEEPKGGWTAGNAPWLGPGPGLSTFVECWRDARAALLDSGVWLRSLRPPVVPLGSGLVSTFRRHTMGVSCVRFFPVFGLIASGSPSDRTIRIWSTSSGRELACITGNDEETFDVSSHGRTIVGIAGKHLCVWSTHTGEMLCSIPKDGSSPVRGVFFFDYQSAFVIRADSSMEVFRLTDGYRRLLPAPCRGKLKAVSFNRKHRILALGYQDGRILVMNVADRPELLQTLMDHSVPAALAISPNASLLASGGSDGRVRVWTLPNGEEHGSCQGHRRKIEALAFSPDSCLLASSGHVLDLAVRIWKCDDCKEIACIVGHDDYVKSIDFSPDGNLIAAASIDRSVTVWKAHSEDVHISRADHDAPLWGPATFSPDGRYVVSQDVFEGKKIWEVERGMVLATWRRGRDQHRPYITVPCNRFAKIAVKEENNETKVFLSDRCPPAAWYPRKLEQVAGNSDGSMWSGHENESNRLDLFALEGIVNPACVGMRCPSLRKLSELSDGTDTGTELSTKYIEAIRAGEWAAYRETLRQEVAVWDNLGKHEEASFLLAILQDIEVRQRSSR